MESDSNKGSTRMSCMSTYTSLTIYPLKSFRIYNDFITRAATRKLIKYFQTTTILIYEKATLRLIFLLNKR